MTIDIDKLTAEELIELNQRVVDRLKFLDSLRTYNEMMQFTPGERVSFEAPGRDRQYGTLVKLNKKTVTVVTESGQRWKVSPHLLNKVKPKKGKSGKVVKLHRIK